MLVGVHSQSPLSFNTALLLLPLHSPVPFPIHQTASVDGRRAAKETEAEKKGSVGFVEHLSFRQATTYLVGMRGMAWIKLGLNEAENL